MLFKKSILYLLLTVASFCHSISYAATDYFLPTSLVNLYLQLHSPVTKDFRPFFKIQLNDVDLTTYQVNQRVYVKSSIRIQLPNQLVLQGKVGFNASLLYDEPTHQVLIKQPQIDLLEIENLNASTEKLLAQINPLLAQLFNGIAVYEFTKENAMVPKAPSQILLEDTGIRFYFN